MVPINTTTCLRAIGIKSGFEPTNVDTHTYIFASRVLQQDGRRLGGVNWGHSGPEWDMDREVVTHPSAASRVVASDLMAIPTISLVLPFDDFFGSGGIYISGESVERNCSIEYLNPEENSADPNSAQGFQVDGTVQIAIDAIGSSLHPHRFLSVTKQGVAAIIETRGNDEWHVMLRGDASGTNYGSEPLAAAVASLTSAGLPGRLMVDCSHANSGKDHLMQPQVVANLAEQIARGSDVVFGVMLESFLLDGNQNLGSGRNLTYGLSVTDKCMSWERTQPLFEQMAQAVRDRRKANR